MRADKQYNYSKPYSSNHSSKMKVKSVGKKECKHKITCRCVIEEETKELGKKLLRCPPSGKSIHQRISWSTRLIKDLPSLIYPMYLSPPSSCYQLTLLSLVFSSFSDHAIQLDCIHQTNGFFQYFATATKPHFTLKMDVVSVWAINLSRIWKWRGRT